MDSSESLHFAPPMRGDTEVPLMGVSWPQVPSSEPLPPAQPQPHHACMPQRMASTPTVLNIHRAGPPYSLIYWHRKSLQCPCLVLRVWIQPTEWDGILLHKTEHPSGTLKSNLMTQYSTGDQIKSNSTEFRQLDAKTYLLTHSILRSKV